MIVSKDNAAHYVWGETCDGWELLPRSDLLVIQERMPPGTAETRHSHRQSRQFFYVLSGVLTMEIEGVTHAVPPGSGIEIAPSARHQASNRGGDDVHFLVISSPSTRGDRVNEP